MAWKSEKGPLHGAWRGHRRFSHTSLATYLTAFFALCCVVYDSTHDIIKRSHINRKWFYLFGAMCMFAYLYVRPLIRRRLGSASNLYINFTTAYIGWLLVAVFYHLPSLESMGINVKADVSMWLTCFLGSLCTLGALQGLYSVAVSLRLLDPRLYSPMAGVREVWSLVLLNAVNLAVACSVYYSFCGNAVPEAGAAAGSGSSLGAGGGGGGGGGGAPWKEAVCRKWLHPVSASSHSAFTRWMIYGEAAAGDSVAAAGGGARLWRGGGRDAANASSVMQIDYPLDGKGMLPIPAADLVSPIFTLWLTLLLLYGANCLADYAAAATLNAAYTADLRRELASRVRSLRRAARRRSADWAHDTLRGTSDGGFSDDGSATGLGGGGGGAAAAWSALASRASFDTLLRGMPSAVLDTVGHMISSPRATMVRAGSMLFRDDFGIGLATSWLQHASKEGGDGASATVPIPADAPAPAFLPMFPWWQGTSADLLKTVLDLVISVRVFLGRFDMRTMQAALAPRPAGPDSPPQGGDGFTFEHLADKEEAWWDFVADTGDGGDPTYAIARCMAAPQIRVDVPPELAAAGAAGPRILPRASVVVHGGDLCYPSPTDETFEQRLFVPYQDAFPPPASCNAGHLVVNKPALGRQHWAAAAAAECRCGAARADPAKPCRLCAKEAALRGYDGPSLFAVPGNHDWIDGLDCFQRHIQHKGWLGGWLMPQEKSYFSLRLPHGWWVLGLDLALVDDIDMCQYSYFARVAEERMGPQDQAVLVLHQPIWLVSWFWGHRLAPNLLQLVRGPLAGRARIALAGDLHFMMRHSFKQYGPGQSPSMAPSEMPTPAGTSPLGGSPLGGSPLGGSPRRGSPSASRFSSRSATPARGGYPGLTPVQLHESLVNRLGGAGGGGSAAPAAAAATAGGARGTPGASPLPAGASPLGTSPEGSWSLLGGASPQARQRSAAVRHSSSEAEAALAALSTSASGRTSSQPISIGGKLAASRPPLPMLSPVHSGASTAAGSGAINGAINGASSGAGLAASHTSSGTFLGPDQPMANGTSSSAAAAPAAAAAAAGAASNGPLPGTSPPRVGSLSSSPFNRGWWPSLRARTSSGGGEAVPPDARSETFASAASLERGGGGGGASGWQLSDPEHLVVCGSGGGFLHPTHVFSEARFRPDYSPAAGPIYLRPAQQAEEAAAASGLRMGRSPSASNLQRTFPSSSSLYSLGHGVGGMREAGGADGSVPRPAGGEYRCDRAFPTPEQSVKLGRANLTFRSVNNRFDLIGGLLYFLLVVSVLPRCSGVAEVLEAHTPLQAAALFLRAGWEAVVAIVSESYVSLATLTIVFAAFLLLCRAGGVGAVPGVPPALRRRPEFHGSTLAVRARVGGLASQLGYAGAHCVAHLLTAVSLLLLLELAIEALTRYEGVGKDGYHSLYKWFTSYEAQHFPDPMGARTRLQRYSLGLYPRALKWVMAVFDVPEAIAVSRTTVCAAGGGLAALTRLQSVALYGGYLAYYWVLATPAVGFLFGCYLYISVNWFNCHYDEAFSSLQIPHFKGFCRFHVTRSGDLEMWGLGLEKVPHAWREDPRWRTPHGGGNREAPAHRAKFPSRWVPVEEKGHLLRPPRMVAPPEAQLQVMDYLLVPKQRPQ